MPRSLKTNLVQVLAGGPHECGQSYSVDGVDVGAAVQQQRHCFLGWGKGQREEEIATTIFVAHLLAAKRCIGQRRALLRIVLVHCTAAVQQL